MAVAVTMRCNLFSHTIVNIKRKQFEYSLINATIMAKQAPELETHRNRVYNAGMADDDRKSELDVTTLLSQAADGDEQAANELLPMVYRQLRAIANNQMSNENPGHTLQATALVNEAFLRLFGSRKLSWQNRAHFYATAAEAMRRVLLDHAKSKGRKKRGGTGKKMPLNVADLAADENPEQILALDAALCRLEEQNPIAAGVVRLRFYAGLSIDQISEALEMSPRTVDRRWKYARAWLFDQLREPD